MSVHSSLSGSKKSARHRNVLKRYERVQQLQNKDLWSEGRSAFGLPKIKSIKFKIKKAAKEAAPAEAGAAPAAGAAAPAATPAAAPGGKPAPAKPGKSAEKGAKK